jgi:hypothetical protein
MCEGGNGGEAGAAGCGRGRERGGVRQRQNVHHLEGVNAYITYIISSRD